MNAIPFNWLVSPTIVGVWAALVWWTLRTAPRSALGRALKTLAVCLLGALGVVMLWNTTVSLLG